MPKYTAGELASMIKKNARMDLAVLGSSATEQNTYIFYYMTEALWKHAGLVTYKRTSEPLVVVESGPVTFRIGDAAVDDMYTPMYILNADGFKLERRLSIDDMSDGWFRESFNDAIDIRGAGTYRLVYRAYHPKIANETDELMWPQTSYSILMYETIGKIKQSKNDDAGAAAAFGIAEREKLILIKSNSDSVGPSRGRTVNHW